MKKPDISTVKSAGEAEQLAISWQSWQAERSMSWTESAEWVQYFRQLAKKFNLILVFKQNGII